MRGDPNGRPVIDGGEIDAALIEAPALRRSDPGVLAGNALLQASTSRAATERRDARNVAAWRYRQPLLARESDGRRCRDESRSCSARTLAVRGGGEIGAVARAGLHVEKSTQLLGGGCVDAGK